MNKYTPEVKHINAMFLVPNCGIKEYFLHITHASKIAGNNRITSPNMSNRMALPPLIPGFIKINLNIGSK